MSGGHYDYLCYRIEDTYEGEMESPILEELMRDICKLLKSLEWYKSGDTSQESYQEDAEAFLDKWTKSDSIAYLRGKSDTISMMENFIKEIRRSE